MFQKISITSIASISSLGNSPEIIWKNYLNENHLFTKNHENNWVSTLCKDSKNEIENLKKSDSKYKSLDNSVLYAIFASRQALKNAGWQLGDNFGINLGSSRGATKLFEQHYKDFLDNGFANVLSSPTTTLGNISSWVAQDLQTSGPEISHSVTCSTALHALLNGIVWLESGRCDKFLVGGSEAPLTDFTIAQMKALKIYANNNDDYPCRTLDFSKTKSTMILGESAVACCIEVGQSEKALATIIGVGYATEILEHSISISTEATCFQKSMAMALQNTNLNDVDVIVMHAPGTIKGDLSEIKAIEKIFGSNIPLLTSNKWKIGHTLGASGMMSIELAVMMLQHQVFIGVPFAVAKTHSKKINKILINAVGFGGNAVSVLLST
ncbi:MAG: beta-ketoacyl synthase [Flavobacterium sp.]|nr:beta-ketoacyl synthase [Flavobacterium sp.]